MTEQPSRLDAIRAALARGYDYHAEQAEGHVRDLLVVVDVERGLKTPQAVADQWHRIADKTRPADGLLAAAFDEKADAWEALA